MTKAKVTAKGQITIPKPIRELLGVHPGDHVVFRSTQAGILVEASTIDIRTLRGALKPKLKGVSVAAMKDAIRKRRRA